MGDLITHERFGGAKVMEQLRDLGVEVSEKVSQEELDALGLREPGYGEQLMGTCTDDEAALFYALCVARKWLEDRSRTLMGEAIASVGVKIRDSDRDKSMSELMQGDDVQMQFGSDESAEEYFKFQQKSAMLHGLFYWTVGERIGYHHHRLGIRSKMRIVTVERRY